MRRKMRMIVFTLEMSFWEISNSFKRSQFNTRMMVLLVVRENLFGGARAYFIIKYFNVFQSLCEILVNITNKIKKCSILNFDNSKLLTWYDFPEHHSFVNEYSFRS